MSIQRLTEMAEANLGGPSSPVPVEDHVIAITIVSGSASQTDTITLGGVDCEFVSDDTPTKQEVSNGLVAAIAASDAADYYEVVQGAGPNYDIILKTLVVPNPTVAVSANLADTPLVVERWGVNWLQVVLPARDWTMSQAVVLKGITFCPSNSADYLEVQEVVPGVDAANWPRVKLAPPSGVLPAVHQFFSGKKARLFIDYSNCSFNTLASIQIQVDYV